MKRMTVTVSYEQEKLKALQFYAGKNGTSLESDLDAFMEKLYKKYVPSRPESTSKAWRNRRNSPVRALPGPLEAPHQTPWTPEGD